MKDNYLKCSECNWQTQRWWGTKRGKKRHGFERLLKHFRNRHEKEYDILKERVEAEAAADVADKVMP